MLLGRCRRQESNLQAAHGGPDLQSGGPTTCPTTARSTLVRVAGFEPAISGSQNRRSGQTKLHPDDRAALSLGVCRRSPASTRVRRGWGTWIRTRTSRSRVCSPTDWCIPQSLRGCLRQESNLHRQLRKLTFCPLNYGDLVPSGVPGEIRTRVSWLKTRPPGPASWTGTRRARRDSNPRPSGCSRRTAPANELDGCGQRKSNPPLLSGRQACHLVHFDRMVRALRGAPSWIRTSVLSVRGGNRHPSAHGANCEQRRLVLFH